MGLQGVTAVMTPLLTRVTGARAALDRRSAADGCETTGERHQLVPTGPGRRPEPGRRSCRLTCLQADGSAVRMTRRHCDTRAPVGPCGNVTRTAGRHGLVTSLVPLGDGGGRRTLTGADPGTHHCGGVL